MSFTVTKMTYGEKLVCWGSEMPEGVCEPARVHCCDMWIRTLHVRGALTKSQDQSIWTHPYLWENKVIVIREKRLLLGSFEYANGADSAPADGSIGHRAMPSTLRARMMAEELCKLASCVSGIQMALNLCLLCLSAQRRRKEKREKSERRQRFCDDWKPQVVRFFWSNPWSPRANVHGFFFSGYNFMFISIWINRFLNLITQVHKFNM